MTKIQTLTPEQTAKMSEWRNKWIEIGLCTKPADRVEAEKAIIAAYAVAGLATPKIVWCASPLTAGLTRRLLLKTDIGQKISQAVGASVGASVRDSVGASVWASVRDSVGASVGASVRDSVGASVRDSVGASVGASVRDSVWASVGASVRDSVGASVGASVWASVRDSVGASVGDSVRDSVRDSVGASVRDSVWASVGASVWASVRDSVWDSVRDSVGASVRDSVWASVRDSVWASVGDSVYGQHDANWLAFYEFFRDVVGLKEQTEKLLPLIALAKHAGWWLPHEKICWVSERHTTLHRDARGRLHCETGPALAYPDGFAIWAWHGVRVSQKVIEQPATITVAEIESEGNAEIRRATTERYGTGRYLIDSGAEEVHRDEYGILYRKRSGEDEIVAVRVVNATPEPDGTMSADDVLRTFSRPRFWRDDFAGKRFKEYFLQVHPELRPLLDRGQLGEPQKMTARNAVASTFGKRGNEYAPQIET